MGVSWPAIADLARGSWERPTSQHNLAAGNAAQKARNAA